MCASDLRAAEEGVPRGGEDLVDAVGELEHAHVERAAAKVEDDDGSFDVPSVTVGQRRRGRLIQEAVTPQARDLRCFEDRMRAV